MMYRISIHVGNTTTQARLEGFFCVSAVAAVLSRLTHGKPATTLVLSTTDVLYFWKVSTDYPAADGGGWAAAWLSSGTSSQGQQSLLPWMAVLQCSPAEATLPESRSLNAQQKQPCTRLAESVLPGTAVTVMGSPFGALSHMHFRNHIATGVIANVVHGQVRGSIECADLDIL